MDNEFYLNLNETQRKILKSKVEDYLAFRFKKDKVYDEEYKWVILGRLGYLFKEPFSEENVAEKMKDLSGKNLNTKEPLNWVSHFSFIAMDNLIKSNPKKVAEALNYLVWGENPLSERINKFRSMLKDIQLEESKKRNVNLDIIAHILASYDYTKYPIYREKIYTNFLEVMGLHREYDNLGEKYIDYLNICKGVLDALKKWSNISSPSILDAQDLLYCTDPDSYGLDIGKGNKRIQLAKIDKEIKKLDTMIEKLKLALDTGMIKEDEFNKLIDERNQLNKKRDKLLNELSDIRKDNDEK